MNEIELFGIEIPLNLLLFYLSIFVVVCLILSVCGLVTAIRARRRMKQVLQDAMGNDITDAIVKYYQKCSDIMNQYNEAESRLQELERNMGSCVKKIGAIRYNAFEESASKLSFAAAVLDDNDSGFVLNGVYSRGQTATYLKPITNGKSEYELSEEEEEAIRTAQYNYEKRMQVRFGEEPSGQDEFEPKKRQGRKEKE